MARSMHASMHFAARRARWSLAALTALATTLTMVIATGPARASTASVAWSSGVYPGLGIDATAATSFGSWRGRPVPVAAVFPERDTWESIRADTWEVRQYAGFTGRLAVAVPLLIANDHDATNTLAAVAAGAHDSDFASMARNLVALGRGNSDLRIGWEFNGNWQPWSAYDAADFIQAFRHVAKIFKAVSPSFSIDWNGNLGLSQAGHDPFTALYPGDDVVDVIGVDAYDGKWNKVTSPSSFASWERSNHGLDAWLAFARLHKKPLSVPEWGLVGTKNGGGDNPSYIQGMYDFFQRAGSTLDYESYFEEPATQVHNSLSGPDQLPKASARYLALWRTSSKSSTKRN